MKNQYIDSLNSDQKAAWGLLAFMRQWLSETCRSEADHNLSLSEWAIMFEITQAYFFAPRPHSQSTLVKELNLPQQRVSRNVRRLERLGVIRQKESPDDARRKVLIPSDLSFTRDTLLQSAGRFGKDWFRDWNSIDKEPEADWYTPPSETEAPSEVGNACPVRSLADVA